MRTFNSDFSSDARAETSKMTAFLALEKMPVPVSQDLDYDKKLAEARDERKIDMNGYRKSYFTLA